MGERRWQFFPLAGRSGPVNGIAVVFARSRCRILSVRLQGLADLEYEPRTGIARGEWRLEGFDPPPPDLVVEYAGEPPQLVAGTWFSEDGARQDAAVPRAVARTGAAFENGACEELWLHEIKRHAVVFSTISEKGLDFFLKPYLTLDPLYALRRQAIEMRSRAEEFFFALDHATDLSVATSSVKAAVFQVAYSLDSRLAVRIQVGVSKLVPQFPALDETDIFGERAALEKIALIFETLAGTHFALDPSEMDWAFEMFATDLLALAHRDKAAHDAIRTMGVPNGALFFQFTELALRCIENDVAKAFWIQHLPALVQCAHVFAEHGVELAVGTAYPVEEEAYLFAQGRFYPRERLEQLRLEYADLVASAKGDDQMVEYLEDRFTWILSASLKPGSGSPAVDTRPLVEAASTLWPGGIPGPGGIPPAP